MQNAHDVGGVLGHGPVDHGDGRTFHAEWEELAFGLTLASIANGFLHNVDENRYAKERMRPRDLATCSYYELWLAALELNLVENGVLTEDEIRRREEEIRAGTVVERAAVEEPAGLADAVDRMIDDGGDTAGTPAAAPRYRTGDVVIVDPPHDRRHSRVPGYAAGRAATVVATLGGYPVPGVVAHRPTDDAAAWCYRVRFEASVLWGTGAESDGDGVYLDVWETDLHPRHAMPPGQGPSSNQTRSSA